MLLMIEIMSMKTKLLILMSTTLKSRKKEAKRWDENEKEKAEQNFERIKFASHHFPSCLILCLTPQPVDGNLLYNA